MTSKTNDRAPAAFGPHFIRKGRWCATWRTANDDGGGIVWGSSAAECAEKLREAVREAVPR